MPETESTTTDGPGTRDASIQPGIQPPVTLLRRRLAASLAERTGSDAEAVESVFTAPPRAELGDLAMPCHRFAKAMGMSPPEVASSLAAVAGDLDFVAEARATGPFLNVTWDVATLAGATFEMLAASLGADWGVVAGDEGAGATLVIDFSSPNAARKLGFHHLRGTAVGAALARLYEARGHDVVRLNHLGDYGHNIGQLLVKLDEVPDGDADRLPPERLQALYVEANDEEREDEERMKAAAGAWLQRLNEDDPVARRRWETIVASTTESLDATYARLGIHFDEYRGESRYVRSALEVAGELVDAGVAAHDPDGGAIFVPEEDGLQAIVLVNRRGTSTYEGRDAAAARDRWEDFAFSRCVYLTDVGQRGRFLSLFGALERAGWRWAENLDHIGFGQMRLGGAKAKTRQGGVVSLDDVLDDAEAEALAQIEERGMDVPDKLEVARQVGIGGVLFSEVQMRRLADFEFDLQKAVDLSGEGAARVQYAHARTCKLLRDEGTSPAEALSAPLSGIDATLLGDPLERQVLLAVAAVPEAAAVAYAQDDPSHVADAVLAVADAWARYQTAGGRDRPDLRVRSDDPELKAARLRLAAAVATSINGGLAVLGVEAPERM